MLFRDFLYDSTGRDKGAVFCSSSCVCRELKGIGTGKVLCSCEDCVRSAVEVFREVTGRETI